MDKYCIEQRTWALFLNDVFIKFMHVLHLTLVVLVLLLLLLLLLFLLLLLLLLLLMTTAAAAAMILVSNNNHNIEYSSFKKYMYTWAEIVYMGAAIILHVSCMEPVRLAEKTYMYWGDTAGICCHHLGKGYVFCRHKVSFSVIWPCQGAISVWHVI